MVPDQQHGQYLRAGQESRPSASPRGRCLNVHSNQNLHLIRSLGEACVHQVLEALSCARAFPFYLLINICGCAALSSSGIFMEGERVEHPKTDGALIPSCSPWRPSRILMGCFGFWKDLGIFVWLVVFVFLLGFLEHLTAAIRFLMSTVAPPG